MLCDQGRPLTSWPATPWAPFILKLLASVWRFFSFSFCLPMLWLTLNQISQLPSIFEQGDGVQHGSHTLLAFHGFGDALRHFRGSSMPCFPHTHSPPTCSHTYLHTYAQSYIHKLFWYIHIHTSCIWSVCKPSTWTEAKIGTLRTGFIRDRAPQGFMGTVVQVYIHFCILTALVRPLMMYLVMLCLQKVTGL